MRDSLREGHEEARSSPKLIRAIQLTKEKYLQKTKPSQERVRGLRAMDGAAQACGAITDRDEERPGARTKTGCLCPDIPFLAGLPKLPVTEIRTRHAGLVQLKARGDNTISHLQLIVRGDHNQRIVIHAGETEVGHAGLRGHTLDPGESRRRVRFHIDMLTVDVLNRIGADRGAVGQVVLDQDIGIVSRLIAGTRVIIALAQRIPVGIRLNIGGHGAGVISISALNARSDGRSGGRSLILGSVQGRQKMRTADLPASRCEYRQGGEDDGTGSQKRFHDCDLLYDQ